MVAESSPSNYEVAAGAPEVDQAGGWVSLRDHLAALRAADEHLHSVERTADARLAQERDQRYAEVKAAEEKALKVKETADAVALGLQRETQTYKDEKANELRSQIERERGNYATKGDIQALSDKFDTAHRPVVEFMAAQIGKTGQADTTRLNVNTLLQVLGLLVTAGILYAAFHK